MFLKHYFSLGLSAQCLFHKHAAMIKSKSHPCFVFQLFTQTLQSHPPHLLSGLVGSWLSLPAKFKVSVNSWQTRVINCKKITSTCMFKVVETHGIKNVFFLFIIKKIFYQIDSITQSGMYILNTVKLVIGNQILLGLDNISPYISM